MADYGSTTEPCELLEYVIVVGSEDHYMAGQKGNWLMFMAQAVRYTRTYASSFDLTTVFYFKGKGHTDKQVNAFVNSVKNYGGDPKAATAWSDVANHVNTKTATKGGVTCAKRVQTLIFLGHGTPGRIWLSNRENIYFTSSEAGQVDASAFVPKKFKHRGYWGRHATSWACQTGNAGLLSPATADDNRAKSLAQFAANSWDIKFYASVTRTDYSNTWTGWRPWDDNSDRRNVDEGVWEDDGADGSVFSGSGSAQQDAKSGPSVRSGMYVFSPGQTSGYGTIGLV